MADSLGAPAIRPAATLIALRDRDALEILMVRRGRASAFMASAWVFPGGAVEPVDVEAAADDLDLAHRFAAIREFSEETGLTIPLADVQRLEYVARWVTPPGASRRFDARFYLTDGVEGEPVADGGEVDAAVWVSPSDALRDPEWILTPPTVAQLEWLSQFTNASAARSAAANVVVDVVAPRLLVADDGTRSVVFPGDPQFERAIS